MLEIKGKSKKSQFNPNAKRDALWKGVVKILIMAIILIALLIGAAVLYAWYTSQKDGGNRAEVVETTKPKPVRSPRRSDPNGAIGVALQYISSPIAPGQQASMTIHTDTDAKCTIEARHRPEDKPKPVKIKLPGFEDQVSDEFGMATWKWTVPASGPLGEWEVEATCANNKNSARYIADFLVEYPKG